MKLNPVLLKLAQSKVWAQAGQEKRGFQPPIGGPGGGARAAFALVENGVDLRTAAAARREFPAAATRAQGQCHQNGRTVDKPDHVCFHNIAPVNVSVETAPPNRLRPKN